MSLGDIIEGSERLSNRYALGLRRLGALLIVFGVLLGLYRIDSNITSQGHQRRMAEAVECRTLRFMSVGLAVLLGDRTKEPGLAGPITILAVPNCNGPDGSFSPP